MSETTLEKTVREQQETHDEVERRRQNEEATPPDRQLEVDPAEIEEGEPIPGGDRPVEPEREDKPTGRALFDASLYESEPLSLPKVDGEGVDKISAKFNGHVRLDRGEPADVALLKGVKLGQTVTLMVECEVGPPVPGMTTNRDGDLDSLGLSRVFTVKSVYRPVPEEL